MVQSGIEVKDLRKQIDDFQLGPINLSLEPGTITALVGKNGAGKSTFSKLLMNLVKRDQGEVIFQGQTVSDSNEEWKLKITYQPQTLFGCNMFNGIELKELISNLYPSWDEDLFSHLVKVFDIPIQKPYGKLSPGVQQQLNIALSLPRDTDILLLDEPTAHMDIPSKQILMDELVAWMERGEKTMLLVSHQVDDIRKLADHIAIFHRGQLIAFSQKDELIQNYKRYWLEQELSSETIPGEIERKNGRVIISNQPNRTEHYLCDNHLKWIESEMLELDEIIALNMKD